MTGHRFSQILLIQIIAIFLGCAFGIFPALMGFFIHPHFHSLTPWQMQSLFIPYLSAAVILALTAGWISGQGKLRQVFVTGMCTALAALGLVGFTAMMLSYPSLTYGVLLGALFLLGGGTSLVILVLVRWIPLVYPQRRFEGALFLWGGVSLGVLMSQGLIDYVMLLHAWWLAPLLVLGGLFICLLFYDLFHLYPDVPPESREGVKLSVFLFLIPCFIYGYLSQAALSLHYEFVFLAFWAAATVSQFVLSLLFPLLPLFVWYCFLPLGIACAPFLFPYTELIIAFSLAPLLPVNLSWMQKCFEGKQSLVSGLGVSCYVLGIALGQPLAIPNLLVISGGLLIFLFHLAACMAFPAQKQ